MHDSDEEEEQTALVCDNGTFFSFKIQKNYIKHFIREKCNQVEFMYQKWK